MKNIFTKLLNKHLLIGIIVGIVIGGFLFENHLLKKHTVLGLNNEKREGMTMFTNPLLECAEGEGISKIDQLNVSKFDLEDLVKKLESKNLK